jgi:hypothetical protein
MTEGEHLPEATRNPLLRRVDWRFLLPNAQPQYSLCLADGLLAAGVRAISKKVVSPQQTPKRTCDLAVMVNPNAEDLRVAWSALQPGGTCYIEWYAPYGLPLLGETQNIQRKLKSSGFIDVECYWVWPLPNRATPLFWLPMEAPEALRYFLTNRPQTHSLLARTIRSLWQWAVQTQIIAPVCTIARKPDEPRTEQHKSELQPHQALSAPIETMEHALHELVCRHMSLKEDEHEWNRTAGSTRDHLSWLLLTGGLRSVNKVIALVFAEHQQEPSLIVKMPRVAESIPLLHQEARVLQAVHALLPDGSARRGVPRVLFFEECAGRLALGETVLTGVPLFTRLRRDNFHALALKVTDWLSELAAHRSLQPRALWWERLVESVLTDFERNFGAVVDAAMLHETRAVLNTLDTLPLVCEQRDFSPWNVLMDAHDELIVLDWESAELNGLPALDLLYFLAYWAFFLDGAMDSHRFVESYRATLDPHAFTGSIIAECLSNYVQRIGLEPTALRPLRVLLWLIHARSEYKHFSSDVAGQPTVDKLRQSVFVKLWAEELRAGR